MTKKKPLVLTNGQIEQLQSGDQIDHRNTVSRDNDNAGAITIGQPVYATSGTNMDLAKADAQGTIRVLGLVEDISIAAAATGDVVVDGILTATTGQWDTVTGDVGGLTPGSDYFLDAATAGKLTKTAPGTGFVKRVGHALSATEFELEDQQPIKL